MCQIYGPCIQPNCPGFPIANDFGAVLSDLIPTSSWSQYNGHVIEAAFRDPTGIHFTVKNNNTVTDHKLANGILSGETFIDASHSDWGAAFGVSVGSVEYEYGFAGTHVHIWRWENGWARISINGDNEPSVGRVITAAFSEPATSGNAYLFSGSEYIVIPKHQDPEVMVTAINTWNNPQNIADHWKIENLVTNTFDRSGIDAAYVAGERLFLIRGNQYVRYTLGTNGEAGQYVDRGYPRYHTLRTIDAAFQLPGGTGETYLFSGGNYYTLQSWQEPSAPIVSEPIKGNWGNIPQQFRSGLDAALKKEGELIFFKGGEYIRYGQDTSSAALPYGLDEVGYEIVRLTSSTANELNKQLFANGVEGLLSLATQQVDEIPTFSRGTSTPKNIQVKSSIKVLPDNTHLDFKSANGMYYWEVFFHAPFLIAQSLNTDQKFEEAKEWYEHIYDPTDRVSYWKFLPFVGRQVGPLVQRLEDESTLQNQTLPLPVTSGLDFDGIIREMEAMDSDYMYPEASAESITDRIEKVLAELATLGNDAQVTHWTDLLDNIKDTQMVGNLDDLSTAGQMADQLNDTRTDFLIAVNRIRSNSLNELIDSANTEMQGITSDAEAKMEPYIQWQVWKELLDLLLKLRGKVPSTHMLQSIKDHVGTIQSLLHDDVVEMFNTFYQYIEHQLDSSKPRADFPAYQLDIMEEAAVNVNQDATDDNHRNTARDLIDLLALVKPLFNPQAYIDAANYLVRDDIQLQVSAEAKAAFNALRDQLGDFQLMDEGPSNMDAYIAGADLVIAQIAQAAKDLYDQGKGIAERIDRVFAALEPVESLLDDQTEEQNIDQQIDKYLKDPFDPHAIAALRTIAYRKAIVMNYRQPPGLG